MRFKKILSATAAFAATVIPAYSQVDFLTSGSCDGSGAGTIQGHPRAGGRMQLVTGVPYSARQSTESIQTLADGTHITRQVPPDTMTWRDSSGRVRIEMDPSSGKDGPCRSVLIEVEDPVAGHLYVIDPINKIAHRLQVVPMPVPARSAGLAPDARPTRPGGPTMTSQPLGKRMMLGTEAEGTTRTMTYPVGSRNDRPLTITDEIWTAPGIGLVYSKNSNPDGTVTTTMLNDLSTAEPDPTLFRIPAGYEIVDEAGPFTISIPAHN